MDLLVVRHVSLGLGVVKERKLIKFYCIRVGGILFIPYILFVPETRQGVLLARRAKKLRKETGNNDYFAAHEVVGSSSYV